MIEWKEILIRLSLAALFGALIGLERERKNWTAGLRTHMMVCVGACLIMIVSAFGFADILGTPNVTLDPSRIAAQVVSGIGFIGAGTILFSKQGTVHGLTTAAGLWTVAAIGLATGSGMYFSAGATTVIALIILWALLPLEHLFSKKYNNRSLKIVTNSNADQAAIMNLIILKPGLKIQSFTLDKNEHEHIYQVKLENSDSSRLDEITNALKDIAGVKEINWEK
ncbi:MAG: MgtC/SapB family protein [Chitinophagaceae bacterium]|jgi:putative Mg2+ transporter-C (MgtC) family protein